MTSPTDASIGVCTMTPTPTDTPPDECRRAFEGAAIKYNYSLATIATEPPKYYEGDTQTAWLFWQACWNRTSPPASNEDAIPNHALDVLKELVSLKMLRDEYGDCLKTAYTDLAFDYRHRKQDAWQEAKAIVETQAAIASMRHHPAPAVESAKASPADSWNPDAVLARLPTEGNRTKYQELEACYAMLFNQYNRMGDMLREERAKAHPVPAAHEGLREAAQKLLVQYDAYQKSAGNCEEAYYKLAKYAYPHWQELKLALDAIIAGETVMGGARISTECRSREATDTSVEQVETLPSPPSPATAYEQVREALEAIASYPDANPISDAHYIARKRAREALAVLPALMPVERGEISDNQAKNDAYLVNLMLNASAKTMHWQEGMHLALKAIRPYLRTTEPVSVDLDAGAKAMWQGYQPWDRCTEEHRNHWRGIAKSVAKVWGLPYED